MRQNETEGPYDMGRDLPQDFTLDQRLSDQPELVIFEIAQPAMHQLGRPGRRPARQVIHFAQENGIPPARRIARDAAAVDAASDDGEIEYPVQRNASPAIASSLRRFYFRMGVNHKEKRKQDERGQCRGPGGLNRKNDRIRPVLVAADRRSRHRRRRKSRRWQSNPSWSATRQELESP